MKMLKIFVITFAVFLIVTPGSFGYSRDKRPDSLPPGGERVYKPLQVTETGNLHIAGIKLSTYHYVEVYQYAVVDEQTLFVVGRTESNEIILSSINLNDKTSISIVKYPIRGNFPITNVQFTIFSMHRLKPTDFYIMVTYTENNSGMRVELTSTIIEVFSYNIDNTYVLINRENFERTNISHFSDPDSLYKYLYYNYTPESVGKIKPARKTISQIFLSDANGDDYTDILIWEAIYLSRLRNDRDKDDFIFATEESSVMYFDNNKKMFLQRTPLK